MKKIVPVVFLVLVVLALVFVKKGKEGAGNLSSGESSLKIGITTFDLVNPYFVNLVNGAKDRAKELGIELIVVDPNSDVIKQVNGIENLIAMQCDGIILAVLDPASTEAALHDAREQGIKILAQSMETPIADIWASAKEWDMGYTIGVEAGKWIKEKLSGTAEVMLLANDRSPQMIKRKEGIIAGIKAHAPAAEVVSVQEAINTQEGMEVTENVLQAHPNVKVIVGINDSGALGALAAVESSNIDQTGFFIGGVDATVEARKKMEEGTVFRASVDNVPYENGKMDIDILKRLIEGEELEYRQVVPVKAVTQEG